MRAATSIATGNPAATHAGVPPSWTCGQTLERAEEVRQRLLRDDYRDFLQRMYGNQPELPSVPRREGEDGPAILGELGYSATDIEELLG